MHVSFKQLYRFVNPGTHHTENLHEGGHFKEEAWGQPLFHGRESVNEIKKRFQR